MSSSQVETAASSPFPDNPCFHNHGDFPDLWVHRPSWQPPTAADDCDKNTKPNNPNPGSGKWAKAREMVFNSDHGSVEFSNLGGVSSLVQKWLGFEANRSKTGVFPDNVAGANTEPPTPSPSPSIYEDDSFLGDWEPAAGLSRTPSRNRDSKPIEGLRVSDIVKRLTVNDGVSDQPRCPNLAVNSPRIRGRQALNDLLMQLERDRYKELEGIVARKPVSKFPHRGRIQGLLRFRFLRRGMEAKDVHIANDEPTDSVKTTDRIHDSGGYVTSEQRDDVGQSSQKVKEASVRLFHSYENIGNAANPFSALIGKSEDLVDSTSVYWVSDRSSNPEVEFQSDNQVEDQEGSKVEWTYQVSRPRTDWEDLRQARYQEMLYHYLDNEDISVLLGRRSVSTFLSSSLREKIEQVMVPRAQGHAKNVQTQEKEKHEFRLSEQDKGDAHNNIKFDEYEEAYDSSVGQQYNNESDDCMDQITTPSWSQNQSSDYSYHHQNQIIASPSTQPSPSNIYSQNSSCRPNSSDSAHPSAIDMELIYYMRGHMEQLHQEMSELRKSIKCCVDMQINLQRSIKQEVATALRGGYSEAKNRQQNAVKKVTCAGGGTGGMCCVCRKMSIDSLLYRCGHMCTCFKCAHKLHWSSGKCPICRAPILDVVRTYSNHS